MDQGKIFVPIGKKAKVQHSLQIYSLSISGKRTEIAPNSLGFANEDTVQYQECHSTIRLGL